MAVGTAEAEMGVVVTVVVVMAHMTAFNATTSWRALIPTQRLESASAPKARIPVRTVQNVNAGGTILDCLRAQINAWTARILVRDPLITNALTAAPSWRALFFGTILLLRGASALRTRFSVRMGPNAKSALQTRFPVRTVKDAKWNRTTHRMEMIGVPFPVGTVWTIFLMIGAMETMEKGIIVVPLSTLITIHVLRMGSSPFSTDVKSARPSKSPLP